MASQTDSVTTDEIVSEHNICQIMDTVENEGHADDGSWGISMSSNPEADMSLEQFRRDPDEPYPVNKSVSALDESCFYDKKLLATDGKLLQSPSDAAVSPARPDIPEEAAMEVNLPSSLRIAEEPAPGFPTVEPAPDIPTVEPAPDFPTVEPAPDFPTVEPAPDIPDFPTVEPAPGFPTVEPAPDIPTVEPAPDIPTVEPAPDFPTVEPAPHFPTVEPAPNFLIPHDTLDPPIMSTPVSHTANEENQAVPDAPLKAARPRKSFNSETPCTPFSNSLMSKTGYTKPPLPRNSTSAMKVPVMASIVSSALDLAAFSQVSPLFEAERERMNIPRKSQKDFKKPISSTSGEHGAEMRSVQSTRPAGDIASGSSEKSHVLAHVDADVEQIQPVKKDIDPLSNRRRKVAVVVPKSRDQNHEKADKESSSSELDCSTPCVESSKSAIIGDRLSDHEYQMTSTPVWQTKHHERQLPESSLSKISNVSSTPVVLPPWKRTGEERSLQQSISQPITPLLAESSYPKPVADERKRSKRSCTIRPDWCLSEEGLPRNEAGSESSRKVSVVNRSTRKVTPYTTGVEGLLIPVDPAQSPLQKLAPFTRKCATTPPLYIVHPITGTVKILEELAKGLQVRCYGIQKTFKTPDMSVEQMAKFYCKALTGQQKTGSFNLAGYSYGGLVAFEMARQLQEAGRGVAALIMLDGSPDYVRCQIRTTRHGLAPDSSPQHVAAVVESHLLLFFIGMYGGPVQQPGLVRAMLEEQASQEDRVAAAVGITMGTVQTVNSPARGLWLGLKAKMDEGRQEERGSKVSVSHVANDVISLRRQQKAMAFIQAADIGEKYRVKGGYRFDGDIHLVRIHSTTRYSCSLSEDYNLQALCSGTAHVHYVDGEHESMMEWSHVESVIKAVNVAIDSVMD